jgi:hypothetical protein
VIAAAAAVAIEFLAVLLDVRGGSPGLICPEMFMYRDNYITALRTELLEMVSGQLTPVAMRYGYSEVPLETNIKWRPQVLVLGNYSSGKSTLINEFLGASIQGTGQAPTDDSFTVITYDESEPEGRRSGSPISGTASFCSTILNIPLKP